jgi:DNA-directed RNA polymerase subunit RPC12/RpoP
MQDKEYVCAWCGVVFLTPKALHETGNFIDTKPEVICDDCYEDEEDE